MKTTYIIRYLLGSKEKPFLSFTSKQSTLEIAKILIKEGFVNVTIFKVGIYQFKRGKMKHFISFFEKKYLKKARLDRPVTEASFKNKKDAHLFKSNLNKNQCARYYTVNNKEC